MSAGESPLEHLGDTLPPRIRFAWLDQIEPGRGWYLVRRGVAYDGVTDETVRKWIMAYARERNLQYRTCKIPASPEGGAAGFAVAFASSKDDLPDPRRRARRL